MPLLNGKEPRHASLNSVTQSRVMRNPGYVCSATYQACKCWLNTLFMPTLATHGKNSSQHPHTMDLSVATGLNPKQLLEVIRTQTEIAKAGVDLGTVMALVAEHSQQLTEADGAVVELAEGDEMVYRAASGMAAPQLGLRIGLQGSLSGLCVRERRILTCTDSENDARVDREACRRGGLRSMVVVPLNHIDVTVGVIKVVSRKVDAFGETSVQLLNLMSELIAAAMFHAARFETSELYHRATHDALTGLANRALYYDRLRQSLALARRHEERLAVLYVDMDDLKPINDQFGHRAGDAALKEIAHRLSTGRRESDTVARMGGDEFALILPRVSDKFVVLDYAQRLAARVERAVWSFESRPLPLRASIGQAVFPEDGTEMEVLLEHADQAMYRSKQQRKGQFLDS